MWSRMVMLTCLLATVTISPGKAAEPEAQGANLGQAILHNLGDGNEKLPPIVEAKPTPPTVKPAPAIQAIDVGTPTLGFASTPFEGRVTLRGDAGRGIGYERGFAYLEGMVPLKQSNGSLFFSDLRIVNMYGENRWEGNLGLGQRWFSEPVNRVLGVNVFYDVRKTDFNTFQQVGMGLEALSPCAEFRLNGYFIVGPAHRFAGPPIFVNQGIFNGNFVTQRLQPIEVAYGGLDLEVGGPLPIVEKLTPRAYVGYYTYSAEGQQPINGIRGRIEAQLTERVSLHFAIQNDRRFDTTVTGGLAVHFGAPAYRRGTGGPASWEDVIRQRVVRDINIVVTEETATTTFQVPVPPPPTPPRPPREEIPS